MNPDNPMPNTTHENPNLPSAPPSCSVRWVDAHKELPDDEMTVLVALADGEVWTGFHEDNQWRFVSADMIEAEVMYWAEFPEPPNDKVSSGDKPR